MKLKSIFLLSRVFVASITVVQAVAADTGASLGLVAGMWDSADVTGTTWGATHEPVNIASLDNASLAAIVSGTVHANDIVIVLSDGNVRTISSRVTGTTGLTKEGSGLPTLTIAAYVAGTTITGGHFALVNPKINSLHFSANAELEFDFNTGDQLADSSIFVGTGKFIKTGGSMLLLDDSGGLDSFNLMRHDGAQ